jgi:hypothetical protein
MDTVASVVSNTPVPPVRKGEPGSGVRLPSARRRKAKTEFSPGVPILLST